MGRGLAGPALDTGGLGHWRLSLAWRRKCFRRSRRQRDGTGLAAALLPRGKRGQDGRLPRSATATRLMCSGRLRPGLWTSGAGPGGSRSAPRLRRGLSAQHRCATGWRRGARGDAPVTPHGTSRTPFPCQWAGGPAEPWAWPHGRPRLPSGQPRALGTVFQNRPVGTENQAAEADTLCTASSVPGRFQHWLFLSKSDCIFEEGTMAVCAGGLHRPSVAMATPTPGTPALSGARVWAGGSGV